MNWVGYGRWPSPRKHPLHQLILFVDSAWLPWLLRRKETSPRQQHSALLRGPTQKEELELLLAKNIITLFDDWCDALIENN